MKNGRFGQFLSSFLCMCLAEIPLFFSVPDEKLDVSKSVMALLRELS